jgi:hypothetical protein
MTGYSITRKENEIIIWSDNKELLREIEKQAELCIIATKYKNGIEKKNPPIEFRAEAET